MTAVTVRLRERLDLGHSTSGRDPTQSGWIDMWSPLVDVVKKRRSCAPSTSDSGFRVT